MFRRLVSLTALAAIASFATAGPQTVAGRVQRINAGVVVLDNDPISAAPFTFYQLDRNLAAKPPGWTFTNPFAPTIASTEISTRYPTIAGETRLSRRFAPWWEINVSKTTDTVLSAYDVLLFAPRNSISLSPAERDRLRKFVDKGGLLWVDLGKIPFGVQFDPINTLPVPFRLQRLGAGSTFVPADFSSPLLNSPNRLTPVDLQVISSNNNLAISQVNNLGNMAAIQLPVMAEWFRFQPIALDTRGTSANQTISAARIGDGWMVVTARGPATLISETAGLRAIAADAPISGAAEPSSRLAFNMISMLDDYRQSGGGTRKAGSSVGDVTAPLLARYSVGGSPTDNPNVRQPAIYRGMVFVSIGDRLYCYDAKPSQDLDGDGAEDDGVADPQGGGIDLIWQSTPQGAALSAPTVTEVPGTTGIIPRVQVLVTTSAGNLLVFNAETNVLRKTKLDMQAELAPITSLSLPNGFSFGGSPLPATAHEGLAYIAGGSNDQDGRVWIVNLRTCTLVTTGANNWFAGNTANLRIPTITASPTVAYIPIADNSGGADKVLYIPIKQTLSGQISGLSNAPQQPGFLSLWLGARGEKPFRTAIDGNVLKVTTRAGAETGVNAAKLPIYKTGNVNEQSSLEPRIVLIDKATERPMTVAQMGTILTGQFVDDSQDEPGMLNFALQPGVTQDTFDAQVAGVRIDYTIDWGLATANPNDFGEQNILRGSVLLPTLLSAQSNYNRNIVGNLAVSARGTIFAVLSDPSRAGSNGSVFAFREDLGRGLFRCVMRYDLFDQHTIVPNQGQPVTYLSNFRDQDGVRNFSPLLNGDFVTGLRFAGGPTIRGDKVFVTAAGSKGIVPVSMVLAFQAEPETPEIKVPNLGENFSIVQPDVLRSTNANQPEIPSILTQQHYRYDRDSGTIRIENLMISNKGAMTSCLSLSQPVLIRRVGLGDLLVEPETAGGRWSPLIWYAVFHGMQAIVSPSAAGNTLYFAGTTLLPHILNTGTLDLNATNGQGYAIDLDISSNDPFLRPSPDRPWNKQFVQLTGDTDGSYKGNEHIVWPQFKGLTGMGEYVKRLNQTIIGDPNVPGRAFGIVAANNTAVAWGDAVTTVFGRADIVVADQNRVARIDASQNLMWWTDATVSAGSIGELASGRTRPLVRPTRAYSLANGDMLIVDAGGNRVVRMAPSGLEVRSIESMIVDPGFVPGGYTSGSPLTLNAPSDAFTYTEYRRKPVTGNEEVTLQGDTEFWVHTVIADTGNRRIVDLVDRFQVDGDGNVGNPVRLLDPTSNTQVDQLGVLFWQSPESFSGRDFTYTSLVAIPIVNATTKVTRYVFIGGVGRTAPVSVGGLDNTTQRASQGGNGGIVLLDPFNPANNFVSNTYSLPNAIASTPLWNDATNTWEQNVALSQMVASGKPIGSVSSLSLVTYADHVQLMVAETGGVYEVSFNPAAPPAELKLPVTWLLPNAVYRALRRSSVDGSPAPTNPSNLLATYAKRLNANEVLVANGYFGPYRGVKTVNGEFVNQQPFRGEVLQITGLPNYNLNNLGFADLSVTFSISTLSNGRQILMPAYADRR